MSKNKLIRLLSIVIPCYKEANTITPTIRELSKVLNKSHLNYEIICVIDGILDNTYEIAKKIKNPHLKVYAYSKNRGKGFAVRYGMSRAKGDVIGFIDANGIEPKSFNTLLEYFLKNDADIVIGSKRHPNSKVDYPPLRRFMSFLSQIANLVLFNLQVKDTQVGIKLFKRKVLEVILPRLVVTDWAFDIEMLAVPHHLGFKKIFESPVELVGSVSKETSAVISKGILKNMTRAAYDAFAVFYRIKVRHYYDDSNSQNWHRVPDLYFRK